MSGPHDCFIEHGDESGSVALCSPNTQEFMANLILSELELAAIENIKSAEPYTGTMLDRSLLGWKLCCSASRSHSS